MNWLTPAELDDTHPYLLGALELPPRGGLILELRLERFDEVSPTVGAWVDKRGQHWVEVSAGQA